jgi:hypothetical protein
MHNISFKFIGWMCSTVSKNNFYQGISLVK